MLSPYYPTQSLYMGYMTIINPFSLYGISVIKQKLSLEFPEYGDRAVHRSHSWEQCISIRSYGRRLTEFLRKASRDSRQILQHSYIQGILIILRDILLSNQMKKECVNLIVLTKRQRIWQSQYSFNLAYMQNCGKGTDKQRMTNAFDLMKKLVF